MRVRSATADDDLDAVNAGSPGWMGQEMMRQLFAAAGDAPRGMFIAELDDVPVGYADWVGVGIADGHRGRATVHVLADHRGRGAGSALWKAVLAAFPPGSVPGVMLSMDVEDARTLSIATTHGLSVGGLHLESELDLIELDTEATRQLATPPPGLTIRPLNPAGDEAEWASFITVLNTVLQDTPDHAQGSEGESPALLRAFLPEPWQVMLAFNGERIVGFTSLSVHTAQTPTLYTHMTGVERDYRGRGLATALKAAHALAVRERGWQRIVTHNLAGNVPILASNKTLGFRRTRALQDLTYDFGPPTPDD